VLLVTSAIVLVIVALHSMEQRIGETAEGADAPCDERGAPCGAG